MANLLDEGVYKGTVRNWGLGMIGEKKTQFAFIELKLSSFQADGSEDFKALEKPVVRRVQFWLNSDKNIKKTLKDFKALGFQSEDLFDFDPELGEFDLTGKELMARCKHGENNQGRPQEQWYLRSTAKPLSLEEKKAGLSPLRARFAEILREEQEKRSKPKSGPAGAELPPVEGNEIPF